MQAWYHQQASISSALRCVLSHAGLAENRMHSHVYVQLLGGLDVGLLYKCLHQVLVAARTSDMCLGMQLPGGPLLAAQMGVAHGRPLLGPGPGQL